MVGTHPQDTNMQYGGITEGFTSLSWGTVKTQWFKGQLDYTGKRSIY